MTIEEILSLGSFDEIKYELTQRAAPKVTVEVCLKQLDPLSHDVFNQAIRPKKTVKKASGQKDDKGQPIYNDSQEEVARIAIPFQQIIVERAIGFLLGNTIQLEPEGSKDDEKQKNIIAMVHKIWSKNKLDYRNKELARKMFSECETAELWYLVDAEEGFWGDLTNGKFKPKMKILAESLGDKLYPYYDNTGDMIAFSREYTVLNDNKEEYHFDIYTNEATYNWINIDGENTLQTPIVNPFKKIPIVYYKQDYPDWYTVQPMIDRLEMSISNRADSNDYSGSPITIVKGQLQGFASKGEQGKVLQVSNDGDVKYLESSTAPESTRLEWDTLREFILSMTQTPDISFSQMKNLGSLSGIALKLMFLDAHMKARTKEGTFGEGIQRRINLLMSIIGNVIDTSLEQTAKTLDLIPVFTPYLPTNEKEEIEIISVAKSAGVISTESGVKKNPLVSDPEAELERIKSEGVESLSASMA